MPLPVLQVTPPSVLNCQVASASGLEMVMVPSWVMASLGSVPVSLLRLGLRRAGLVWSMVMAAVLLPTALVLPAASV